jgi:hypothetical protein
VTDFYAQCEGDLMTKIKTLTNYFPKEYHVSSDDSILNKGGDYFAIFQPDAFPATRADGTSQFFNWVILFDLYVRYTTRAEALPRFKAVRAALIELLHPAALNGAHNISRLVLSANGGLQQDLPGDNPNFLIQTLTATITQRVTFKP